MKTLTVTQLDNLITPLVATVGQLDRTAQRLSLKVLSLGADAIAIHKEAVDDMAAANVTLASKRAELNLYEQARKEAVRLQAGIEWEDAL